MKGFRNTAVPVILILLSTGCFQRSLDTIDLELAGTNFTIEIASTPEEQQKGLMERSSLPPNRGMLFVYPYDKKMSFWMKNTSIPLSIGYISADGILKEVHELEPYNTRPVKSSVSVRYALELNRGVFRKLGLSPGDKLFERDEIELLLDSVRN